MPEGDTIYRAARALGLVLEGKVVTRFETALAPLASVDDNDPGARLWVYRRQDREGWRCGTAIVMRRQGAGARSTYWCPVCQPESPC